MRAVAWAVFVLMLGCGEDPPARVTPVAEPARPTTPTLPAPTPAPTKVAPAPAPAPAPEPEVVSVARAEPAPDDPRRQMPLPSALGDRVRRELRAQAHTQVQLRETLYLRAPDGRATLYALTEHGAYDGCIHRPPEDGETREEILEDCRDRFGFSEEEFSEDHEDPSVPCTVQRIVRFDLPTNARESLEVAEEHEIEHAGCTLTTVRSFAFRDFDGDGKRELEVDLIGVDANISERSGPYRVQLRRLSYYRDDLTPQYEETLTYVGGNPTDAGDYIRTARRLRFSDANGDGHADLLFDQVTYEKWPDRGCHEDEIGWPRVTQRRQRRCSGEIQHETWLYDATRDEWLDPSP